MKTKKSLQEIDFKYSCEIKYDTYYQCQHGSDCCNNDYCRCGTIEDARVVEVPNMAYVVEKVAEFYGLTEEIDLYACDRLLTLHKAWDKDFYEVSVCGGYYGEEIDSVHFGNSQKLELAFEEYCKLKQVRSKVEFLLKAEYGHLIDSVQDKTWKIKLVKKDHILFGNKDYYRKMENEVVENYKDYSLPKGICLQENDKFRIIDGYHRLSANTDEKVKVIVGK